MRHPVSGKIANWLIGFFLLGIVLLPVTGSAASIDPFIGEFHGTSIDHADGELALRDLDVSIEEADRGFIIEWTTVIYKNDGRKKTVSLEIEFYATDRPDIYGSAMRSGLFGKRIPNDPLKGEPFVWARIFDKTLTVHALYITDDAGYEMQVYERRLDEDGNMDLVFKRFRDGKAIRDITGKLIRQ